jgi:hypothetical protein
MPTYFTNTNVISCLRNKGQFRMSSQNGHIEYFESISLTQIIYIFTGNIFNTVVIRTDSFL